jgi:TolB protein
MAPAGPIVSAQQPQQPGDVSVAIVGDRTSPPRLAVLDFLSANDAEARDVAQTISKVLVDDLNFEHEFSLMPRDIVSTIPAPTTVQQVAIDRWREVNADGVLVGSVQKSGNNVRIEVRLFNVRTGQSVFNQEYTGPVTSRRLFAHSISDDIHLQQRNLKGVARSKLAFNSDRDGERISGTIEQRGVREIYIADYDGENQRRVTVQRSLNINSTWSPDGRSIAYTSYQRGVPNIFISNIYQGTRDELTKGAAAGQNVLPVWSPDGTRLAFASSRDGNFEIYIANRDGSGVRRLTNHPAADTTPTWAPSGTQIAFTSDRTGTPQIYIVGTDGLGLRQVTHETYADRPTWSPAPYNEIAYAAQTSPGHFDIKVLELASGAVRQVTFGEGSNESPSFSANGRHLVFMSTRAGRFQIFTVARDGRDVRQITRAGENRQPDWSK